jgi:hypothetical protein
MAFLTKAANRGSIATGYDIDNSCKFESDNSEYLSKTPSSAGNRKTWTLSCWVKRTEITANANSTGNQNMVFSAGDTYLQFDGNAIWINHRAASENFFLATNRLFVDPYAWYHIVWQVDTTQATNTNRAKLYINGIQETSFQNSTYDNMPLNYDTLMNSTSEHEVGKYANDETTYAGFFNGYIAEMHLVDGTALDPTDFGEFDSDSNIWKPKSYAGSYGTNGFYLDFKDASNMGNDANGGTDFAETNITAANQATDSPTNNFPILVPMYAYAGSSGTLSEGGLEWDINMPSGSSFYPNTSAMSSFQMSGTNGGKWYMESKITSNNRAFVGIVSSLAFLQQTTAPTEFVYWDFYNGWIGSSLISTETNPPDAAVNTIIGLAIDCDNQRITFSKNGGWLQANGDMNGSTPSDWRWDWTSDADFLDHPNCNGNVAFWCGIATDANVYRPIHQVNFGGFSPYTISSGNADENGYGNFEYAVPSGFYALCTKNLAEYG